MATPSGHEVYIFCYDLSNGMAEKVPPAMTGDPIVGVWHSAVVCFEYEYFFGGGSEGPGVCRMPPCTTPFGKPTRRTSLGYTKKTMEEFEAWRAEQNEGPFRAETYVMTGHNCNHFTHEALCFLLDGKGAPDDVINMIPNMIESPVASMLFMYLSGGTMTLDQALSAAKFHPMAGNFVPTRDNRACDWEEAEARRRARKQTPFGIDGIGSFFQNLPGMGGEGGSGGFPGFPGFGGAASPNQQQQRGSDNNHQNNNDDAGAPRTEEPKDPRDAQEEKEQQQQQNQQEKPNNNSGKQEGKSGWSNPLFPGFGDIFNNIPGLGSMGGGGGRGGGGGGARGGGMGGLPFPFSFPGFGGGSTQQQQQQQRQRHADPNKATASPKTPMSSQASFVEEVFDEKAPEAKAKEAAQEIRDEVAILQDALNRSVEAHHQELELLIQAISAFNHLLRDLVAKGDGSSYMRLDDAADAFLGVTMAQYGRQWLHAIGFRPVASSASGGGKGTTLALSPLHAARRDLFEAYYKLAAGAQEAAEVSLALRESAADEASSPPQRHHDAASASPSAPPPMPRFASSASAKIAPAAPGSAEASLPMHSMPTSSNQQEEIVVDFSATRNAPYATATDCIVADLKAVLTWTGMLLSPASPTPLPKHSLSIEACDKPLILAAPTHAYPPGEFLGETGDDLFDPDSGNACTSVSVVPPLIAHARGVCYRRVYRGVSIPPQNWVTRMHKVGCRALGTIRLTDGVFNLLSGDEAAATTPADLEDLCQNFVTLATARGIDGWVVELPQVNAPEPILLFAQSLQAAASQSQSACWLVFNTIDALIPLEATMALRDIADVVLGSEEASQPSEPTTRDTTTFEVLRPTKGHSLASVLESLRKKHHTAPCIDLEAAVYTAGDFQRHVFQCGVIVDALTPNPTSVLGTQDRLPFRTTFDLGVGAKVFAQGQVVGGTPQGSAASALHVDRAMSTLDAPSAVSSVFARPVYNEAFLGHSSLQMLYPRGANHLSIPLVDFQGVLPAACSATSEPFLTIQIAVLPQDVREARLVLTVGQGPNDNNNDDDSSSSQKKPQRFVMSLIGASAHAQQPDEGSTAIKAAYESTSSSKWVTKRFALPVTTLNAAGLTRDGFSLQLVAQQNPNNQQGNTGAMLIGALGVDFVPISVGASKVSALSSLHPTSALARSFCGGVDPTSLIKFSCSEGLLIPLPGEDEGTKAKSTTASNKRGPAALKCRLDVERCALANRQKAAANPKAKSFELSTTFDPVGIIVTFDGQFAAWVNLPVQSTVVTHFDQLPDLSVPERVIEVGVQAVDGLGCLGSVQRVTIRLGNAAI